MDKWADKLKLTNGWSWLDIDMFMLRCFKNDLLDTKNVGK